MGFVTNYNVGGEIDKVKYVKEIKNFAQNAIIIESACEHPNEISLLNGTETDNSTWLDENEYLLSEDMIGQIKDIIYKRDLLNNVRETNEIQKTIKF